MNLCDVRLSSYDNAWYEPGPFWKRALWLMVGYRATRSGLPSSGLRVSLLRLFGAVIGNGVVIKPGVRVKYPWFLVVGDHTWIGEDCWIDNLTTVRIGSNVCLSQGTYLCTGNHDWSDPAFGLRIAPVLCMDGSWAGAKSVLGPGATLGVCAVAAAGAVVTGVVPDYQIFAGNPATFVRRRVLKQTVPARNEVAR
ncbi:WcaF family extracellular polysaccharide biosynthesis acetyltransferase [Terriglobus aquaticus]|uniref:WcaF family extracellular polysaccharide biosynthesis acetyltransferase n=1 Tax=Terriglobus aquaticus TaxID=940139 RepID=A0ABW9KGW1_9BACT|nr:WcaF family extracellular polysaccharide biosynthesis acetyltransferase [Terriglobus aquaticus]